MQFPTQLLHCVIIYRSSFQNGIYLLHNFLCFICSAFLSYHVHHIILGNYIMQFNLVIQSCELTKSNLRAYIEYVQFWSVQALVFRGACVDTVSRFLLNFPLHWIFHNFTFELLSISKSYF